MELTINNLIKIALAAGVIIIMILGISMAVKNYVIPYFSGIGFEEPKIDTSSQFGKELIQGKNKIGIFKEINKFNYFIYNEKKTSIYFKKNEIYLEKSFGELEDEIGIISKIKNSVKDLYPDEKVGYLDNEGKIIIERDIILNEINYRNILNGAYKYGLE